MTMAEKNDNIDKIAKVCEKVRDINVLFGKYHDNVLDIYLLLYNLG